MAAELHLAENALALHLLLERLEGLVDIVVTDEYLHASFLCSKIWKWKGIRPGGNGGTIAVRPPHCPGAPVPERARKVHLGPLVRHQHKVKTHRATPMRIERTKRNRPGCHPGGLLYCSTAIETISCRPTPDAIATHTRYRSGATDSSRRHSSNRRSRDSRRGR